MDELIDSRSVPTPGARTGKTLKGSQGEVTFKTPVTDQTPYRSKYTGYRHQSPPTDDWDDSPTESYGELDSAFRDEGDLFSKEGGWRDTYRRGDTPKTHIDHGKPQEAVIGSNKRPNQ